MLVKRKHNITPRFHFVYYFESQAQNQRAPGSAEIRDGFRWRNYIDIISKATLLTFERLLLGACLAGCTCQSLVELFADDMPASYVTITLLVS